MYHTRIVTFILAVLCTRSLSQPTCVTYTPSENGITWNLNSTITQTFQAKSDANSISIQFYRDNTIPLSFVATLNLCEVSNCTTQLATTSVTSSSSSLDINFTVKINGGEQYAINLLDNSVSTFLKLNPTNVNGSLIVNGVQNDTSDLAYAICLDPGCTSCTSDSDCSGQGVCINTTLPFRYCSCFSGFGGCNCAERPASQCPFSDVTTMTNNFEANVSLDYQYPVLVIGVSANLEENKFQSPAYNNTLNVPPYSEEVLMYFGNTPSAYPSCSFPAGSPYEIDWKDFAASSGDCTDKYLMNMTWATAKSQCGFASTDGSRTFTQTITVQRYYLMESSGTRRVEQTQRFLNVIFPTEVQVSTDSSATISFPSASVNAIIVANDYDPYSELWSVVVQTSIASPYVLEAPYSTIATGGISDRLHNISVAAISGCTNQSSNACVQHFTFLFDQGSAADSCLALIGSVTSLANVTCTTSACPVSAPVNLTMTLHTGNACPVTDQIDWTQATLRTYQDSSVSTLQSQFSINDVAYFGAIVETTEAVITSRTVEPGSVCFQGQSGVCTPVAYTVVTSTNGNDPVFSVNFRDPANFGLFSNSSQPTSWTIRASIQVSFATKSLKNKPSSQKATVSATAIVDPNAEKENQKDANTDMTVPMIVAGAVAAAIVVGGLIGVTVFFKKRTERRRQSKMHLDSVYESCRSSQISIHEDNI